jgi:hypothetical protein
MAQDDPGYQDVTCSFCDRHNRDVHLVAGRHGLTICQVCVARCAEILDTDADVDAAGPPITWPTRWSTKAGSRGPVRTVPHSAP